MLNPPIKEKVNNTEPLDENLPVAPAEVSQLETAPAPEMAPPAPEIIKPAEREKSLPKEEGEGFLDETISALKKKLKSQKKKPTAIPQVKDKLTVEIENIMEEDLKEAYQELTLIQQQEFRIKGEETAYRIRDLLKSAHVRIKSVFKLILEWLKMLPGINRFFLEQEAKIKTDKIVALKERFK